MACRRGHYQFIFGKLFRADNEIRESRDRLASAAALAVSREDADSNVVSVSSIRLRQAPYTQFVKKWAQKFEETGSTKHKSRRSRPEMSRVTEDVENVPQSIRESCGLSVRRSPLNVPESPMRRILRKDLRNGRTKAN
ncbi:hypothetical protein Trydic_g14877 [Trypoxylus dichotomus]